MPIPAILLGAQACPELAEWASRLPSLSGNRTTMTQANRDLSPQLLTHIALATWVQRRRA